ncbi:MAG: arsenate reductase ArsC [Candidatus Bathyarchaeota archaeon]|nr:arsenate reductase ArsC [Candidatus Bathyarchaeota archaeon]
MTKTLLFVCIGNSGRSQMAEAFFNKLSKTWNAISAGTKPDDSIHPYTIRVMKEVGVDVSKQKPKLLTREMVEKTDKIITMGCGADVCPASYLQKVEDWAIEEPYGKPIDKVREIRDQIKGKVEKMIREIES